MNKVIELSKKRFTEIDVAKGFALFLMVLGHVVESKTGVFNWIFSFHMPAFFFLSGMTIRPEKYLTFPAFVKDKFKKRVIPYFIICLCGFIICMAIPSYRAFILEDGWQYQLTWIFYYAQPRNLYVGQSWFLIGLFMSELIFYIWHRCVSGRGANTRVFSVLVLIVIGYNIRSVDQYLLWGNRLPWKMDMAWIAAVFMIAGYYTQKYRLLKKLAPYAWSVVPILTLLSYYFGPRLGGYVNICDCVYSPAPYYFTAAFCGIFAMCITAYRLRGWKFWQFCGQYSLPMFAAQTFAIYWFADLIKLVTGVYYPPQHGMPSHVIALGITVGAFAILVVFAWVWRLCQKKLNERK